MDQRATLASRDLKRDAAFIKQVQLFSDLSDEEIESLLDIVTHRTFNKGDTIIQDGDLGDEMYVLLEGDVQVAKSLTLKVGQHEFEETEKSLTQLRGEWHLCFGEMAMLDRAERSASIVALTHCVTFVIDRERFDRFCGEYPRAGYHIMKRIAQVISGRLRTQNEDVLKLTTALSLALARR